jgi:PAS domain S-box-containing protein
MEPDRVLNVAIVGGGPGCKAVMDMIFAKRLSQLNMKLVAVACSNPEAVGYRYAQEKGVYTTEDYRDLYELQDLDMIIELTGRADVANEIARTKPVNVRLMDHVAAHLFWDIFQVEEERMAQRRRDQEAIERAEKEKETILDSLVELVTLQDKDLRILWPNRAACESVNMTREEMTGLRCYDIWHGRQKPCTACPVVEAMETGRPEEGERVTPDGRVWFVRGYPVRDEVGQMVGAVEVTLEITKRKKVEEALQKSQERFRDVVYSMADWIWEVDEKGVYTFCSGQVEEILGFSTSEMVGKRPFDFMADDEAKRVGEIFSEIARDKRPIKDLENWNIRKDGAPVCLLTNGVPILDDEGNLKGYRGVDTDITDRKRVEEERMQKEKLQGVLETAGAVCHEFNQPLQSISGFSDLLMMDIDEDDPHFRYAEAIQDQVHRMGDLTKRLLEIKDEYATKPYFEEQIIDIGDESKKK